MSTTRLVAAALFGALLFAISPPVSASTCVNRYVFKNEGPRLTMTLLTGSLTFQEAKDLAQAIREKQAEPIEWVDGTGKLIARQVGHLEVVRPMPVGCDGRTSGSVVAVTFLKLGGISGDQRIKLGPDKIVSFEEQKK